MRKLQTYQVAGADEPESVESVEAPTRVGVYSKVKLQLSGARFVHECYSKSSEKP